MKNQLSIKREYWPEATDMPHFIVNLEYEGCKVAYDDIYFDDISEIIARLEVLERDREGEVKLDGGFRLVIAIEATITGGLILKFLAETAADFPGKLIMNGYFPVDGEWTLATIKSLIALFESGTEFVI